LPAPASTGGENGGAAAAVVLGDEQRLLMVRGSLQIEKLDGAGLGITNLLVVGDGRQLLGILPVFGVSLRVFVQPANDALTPLRG